MARGKRPRKREGSRDRPKAVINPNAAGIDVGAREIYVAVPAERDPEAVRMFATFTPDLIELAEWLAACGITTVAMEATSVYWMPLFTILEERGIEVCLVNARHLRRVPGRKTHVLDCETRKTRGIPHPKRRGWARIVANGSSSRRLLGGREGSSIRRAPLSRRRARSRPAPG